MRRLPFLLLAAAALLAGCGGGGGGDAEEITEVLTVSATSRDPADCRRYATLNALEQSTKAKGDDAILACEESKLEPRELPRSVKVTRIDVDGDAATAQVASVDGPFSEQEIVIALVKEDGSWKEDEALEFAVFDRQAFILEFGRSLMEEASTREEADVTACLIGEMDELTDAELEALILGFSPQPIIDLALVCKPRSQAV